ncbi:MAG: enolase C-terminal domain-like protein [Candidatus Aenigmatarchaeota archaeon]
MIARRLEIRQIFATNSKKTIEVEIETAKGKVRASVPIGTSRGKHEVFYLPTEEAINKFNLIRRSFTNEEFKDQEEVDELIRTIDKTPELKEIGGNLALAISSAFLKAFALNEGLEVFEYLATLTKSELKMPKPVCNVAGGWKESRSDIQEFLLLPVHQSSFFDSISKISQAYLDLSKTLKQADPTFAYGRNWESGWVTNLNFIELLNILKKIANENLLRIGLDIAASQLWDGNQYYVYRYSNKILSRIEQLRFIQDLAKEYPISYIEDPFMEDDFVSFASLTSMLPNKLIVADDLFATNLKRLKDGIELKAANAMIVKPSQAGTISDVIRVVKLAKENNIITVMSHRSGETEDDLIAHLAIGLGCEYVKFGISGERINKLNEMIRIEEKISEEF